MNWIILECVCMNSRAIPREYLERNAGGTVGCRGYANGEKCKRRYNNIDLLNHADKHGVYWASEVKQEPVAAGPS